MIIGTFRKDDLILVLPPQKKDGGGGEGSSQDIDLDIEREDPLEEPQSQPGEDSEEEEKDDSDKEKESGKDKDKKPKEGTEEDSEKGKEPKEGSEEGEDKEPEERNQDSDDINESPIENEWRRANDPREPSDTNPEKYRDLPEEKEKDLKGKLIHAQPTVELISAWRRKFFEILSRSTGIKLSLDPEAPHRRIEGELGAEVEVKEIKAILVIMDQSGSMDREKFKQCISAIEAFVVVAKRYLINTEYHVVSWGDLDPVYFSSKYKKEFLNQLKVFRDMKGNDLGTLNSFIDGRLKGYGANPDLVIHLTDCDYYYFDLDKKSSKVKKIYKKMIWVLTTDTSEANIKNMLKMDPSASRRIIKQTE